MLTAWGKYGNTGTSLPWNPGGCVRPFFSDETNPRRKWLASFRSAGSLQVAGMRNGKVRVKRDSEGLDEPEGSPSWGVRISSAWEKLCCAVRRLSVMSAPTGLWNELPGQSKNSTTLSIIRGMCGSCLADWDGVASVPPGEPRKETMCSSADGFGGSGRRLKKSKKTGCSYRVSGRKRLFGEAVRTADLGPEREDARFDRALQLEKTFGDWNADLHPAGPTCTIGLANPSRNDQESAGQDIFDGGAQVSQRAAPRSVVGSTDGASQSRNKTVSGQTRCVADDGIFSTLRSGEQPDRVLLGLYFQYRYGQLLRRPSGTSATAGPQSGRAGSASTEFGPCLPQTFRAVLMSLSFAKLNRGCKRHGVFAAAKEGSGVPA